jgi:cell division septal protein FtsQ
MKRLLFIILALLLAGLFLAVNAQLFLVRKINCKTQYGQCTPADEAILNQFYGQNLFLVTDDVVHQAFFANPKVSTVRVYRVFPWKLEVFLLLKKALAGVRKSSLSQDVFLVDNDGIILALVHQTALPVISLEDSSLVFYPFVSAKVDEKITNAARVLYTINEVTKVTDAVLEDGTLRTILPEKITLYLPLDRDPKVLAGALQLILAKSKMQKELKEIDLRYKNAILRY